MRFELWNLSRWVFLASEFTGPPEQIVRICFLHIFCRFALRRFRFTINSGSRKSLFVCMIKFVFGQFSPIFEEAESSVSEAFFGSSCSGKMGSCRIGFGKMYFGSCCFNIGGFGRSY